MLLHVSPCQLEQLSSTSCLQVDCAFGIFVSSPKKQQTEITQFHHFISIMKNFMSLICTFIFIVIPFHVDCMIITSVVAGPKKYNTVSFDLFPLPLAFAVPNKLQMAYRGHYTFRRPFFNLQSSMPVALPMDFLPPHHHAVSPRIISEFVPQAAYADSWIICSLRRTHTTLSLRKKRNRTPITETRLKSLVTRSHTRTSMSPSRHNRLPPRDRIQERLRSRRS